MTSQAKSEPMNNYRSIITFFTLIFCCCCPSIARADAESKENFIGPAITIGNGQSIFGIEGKFNLTDNIAVRPSYSFTNLSGAGVTVFGGSATYDLSTDNPQIMPFLGLGMNFYTVNVGGVTGSSSTGFAQAGVDVNLNPGLAVTGDIKVPFDANSVLGTVFSIGGGYRF
jgi:opacity protein-like surface antigen